MQSKDKAEAAADGGGGGGMFRGLIDTVIGNLRLSITNVHIRYEVRLAPGRLGSMACSRPHGSCQRPPAHVHHQHARPLRGGHSHPGTGNYRRKSKLVRLV